MCGLSPPAFPASISISASSARSRGVRRPPINRAIPARNRRAAAATRTATPPSGGKGMTVTAVAADGRPLTFQHDRDRVHVTLPRGFQPGEVFRFTLDYHGVPATGILVANNKYGDRGFFSNPWPNKARNYLASLDHPSAKAPVTTIVTAPRRYQVIANGRLTDETDLPNDLRRTVWTESSPMCTCLMSLGVAPFAVAHFGEYHGIPLSAWVYPQEKEVSVRAFSAYTQPILEFFIDHIGPYSYEKLAQVAGQRHRRRHGARVGHLLRLRARPGRAVS